jgi:hypothetical protein
VYEWVGGRITVPVYIAETEPYRPEMVLWLELPEGYVVGQTLTDPTGPPLSFRDTLLRAMAAPLVGAPRKPKRIRVSEPTLAMELRGAVPGAELVVAPTPELDSLMAQMMASMPAGGGVPSYFEHGRIGADTLETLFQAADALFRSAPWKLVQDAQAMRLDIPALGVEGACVSIIGALGESLGLVIFPSHLAMEQFVTKMQERQDRDAQLDMGTSTLSLNFERGASLPVEMRREVAEHGWPVASPAAYPWVQHRDRDGMMRPLEERDVRIAAACASGVVALFSKHRERFERASPQPLSERFESPEGVEVRLAIPYETGGSPVSGDEGRKSQPQAARADVGRSPSELHQLDGRLVEAMMELAEQRFGNDFARAALGITERAEAIALLAPFLVYQVLLEGKPVAHWFAQENASRLSDTERTWRRAQQAAWLSVWEGLRLESGRSLKLRDLLTGQQFPPVCPNTARGAINGRQEPRSQRGSGPSIWTASIRWR